ncbi:FMN-dependent NADH-azoreductase [Dyadobacter subterraneus]|uniref:FMN dependent NADH:quinone oxidoreductase n=1 Tax=Dyadobacter subterraneus TaxID=2773304 RepID=A0ABR9WEJ1_9BACT|nr:NAD(P)H-dependent oxidoreductase [Dyadobacter subterraneus]MBE9463818.1 NAD(P)H-dependent oxidoreductase [Dyadobacter subterraneus]
MRIFHLISSPRGEASISTKLSSAIVEKLIQANVGSIVTTRNLSTEPFPNLEEVHIGSFFTPEEEFTPELAAAAKKSEDAIAQLLETDIIVIGAPMYNFTIHTALKSWIDHIVRANKTFAFTENGAQGFVTGKKLYIGLSSGGIFTEGPFKLYDFAEPYLRFIFGFIGITDVTIYRVQGLNVPIIKETALQQAIDSIVI